MYGYLSVLLCGQRHRARDKITTGLNYDHSSAVAAHLQFELHSFPVAEFFFKYSQPNTPTLRKLQLNLVSQEVKEEL